MFCNSHFFQHKRGLPILFSSLFLLIFSSSCFKKNQRNSQTLDTSLSEIPGRFSADLVKTLFTDEFVAKEGKQVPKMNPVQLEAYGAEKKAAPAAFQNEFVSNPSQAVELWAYLNLGEAPSGTHIKILKETFTNLSTWRNLSDSKNKLFFKTFKETERDKRAVNPASRSTNWPAGDLNYVTAELDLQGPPVPVILDIAYVVNSDEKGIVTIDLLNTRGFSVVVPILDQGAMRSRLEFYPYRKGYLIYAAGGLRINGVGFLLPKDLLQEISLAVVKKSRSALLGLTP